MDTHTLEEDCKFFAFVDTWEEFRVFASFVTGNVGKIDPVSRLSLNFPLKSVKLFT